MAKIEPAFHSNVMRRPASFQIVVEALPHPERVARLRTPEVRAALFSDEADTADPRIREMVRHGAQTNGSAENRARDNHITAQVKSDACGFLIRQLLLDAFHVRAQ